LQLSRTGSDQLHSEKLLKYDAKTREFDITVIGEEPYHAYNRVGLTSFFEHRKIENLYLNPVEWVRPPPAPALPCRDADRSQYESAPEGALTTILNNKVTTIDTENKTVTCEKGEVIPYDTLVLATGSDAIVPRFTPGWDATGVFVYRTIEDLDKLIEFSGRHKGTNGLVLGGGLLGLEAAKALMDLENYNQIGLVERGRWVLSRQVDEEGGAMVAGQVRELGVNLMTATSVAEILRDDNNKVKGVSFEGDVPSIEVSTVVFAIGVRPRDELMRKTGLKCADRGGGVIVDDELLTSHPDIYAIGECASWGGMAYGLIGPGVEMADILAFNLTQAKLHQPRMMKTPDLSTKLKLLGVHVASFGDCFADRDGPKSLPPKARRASKAATEQSAIKTITSGPPPSPVKALTYKDPFANVYKKYIFTMDGKYLLGGIMIGDTNDYIKLVPMVKNMKELDMPPSQLILGAKKDGEDSTDDLDDDTQICSCHNVTKGGVAEAVKSGECKTIADVKSCTKAGTGCGGCLPLVTSIFNKTMAEMGNEVTNYVCSHFNYSRAELYHIIMVKGLKTLAEVMKEAGNDPTSLGCEMCKPAVGSIFSSLWNRHVMSKPTHGLQDTNDKFLGNMQRNGTYSVIPRMAGGEITPDKLSVIADVAKEYNLYTKITGGQRIDMFGARKQDLIDIWRKLVEAGMESGHAYAKSLRTVKSCVGTTWCRFGIGDSVGMAVRLEERYKSIRSPHKLKGGVSGCVRECAEAQNKE
jgi:nitrite reductase (NAD(P)H)